VKKIWLAVALAAVVLGGLTVVQISTGSGVQASDRCTDCD
jgi:hypothetical protein